MVLKYVFCVLVALTLQGFLLGDCLTIQDCIEYACVYAPRELIKAGQCKEITKDDKDVKMPKGPHVGCCPVFKCKNTTDNSFYVHHGLKKNDRKGRAIADTELRLYSGDDRVGRSVLSVATGAHDATADAGSVAEIEEMHRAFADAGIFV